MFFATKQSSTKHNDKTARNINGRFYRFITPITALLLATLPPLVTAEEMVKWVDENGRVHYGDTVPQKYRDQAESIEIKEAPKLGLSEEEIKTLERKAAIYKQQVEREKRAEQRRAAAEANRNAAPAPPPKKAPLTREQCRDKYPSKTADRVRCFKEAEN